MIRIDDKFWRRALCCALMTVFSLPASALLAQDAADEEEKPAVPLFVANVASFDKIFKEVDGLFAGIERRDVADFLAEQLEKVDNLVGLDRTKPFGVMLFMEAGFPPQFTPVGYFPVADPKAVGNAKYGQVTVKPVEGETNVYEVTGPPRRRRGRPQRPGGGNNPGGQPGAPRAGASAKMIIRDGYAFVSPREGFLDLVLPDPEKISRRLSSKYDIAASYNLTSIPRTTLNLFVGFLTNAAETELQQRDDEPEGAYKIRRANGVSMLELLEQLLTQTDEFTIGLNKSKQAKSAVLEFSVKATPGSKFAKYLKAIGGKRSYFHSLIKEDTPFTVALSWALDAREKKAALESLEGFEIEAAARIGEEGEKDGPIQKLVEILKETADAGHVDFLAQMVGNPKDKFVLLGGFKLVGGNGFAAALEGILDRLSDSEALNSVKLNVDSHAGMQIHRIEGKQTREEDKRLYGESPALFVGSTPKAVWFAIGADDAIPALKKAMDTVAEGQAEGRARKAAPLTVVVNAGRWLGMEPPKRADGTPRVGPFEQLGEDAFTTENDDVKFELTPTDDGARLRIEFNEGFLRLLALGLSRQFDRAGLSNL